MFLDKFVSKIIPEYMSQRDFLTCVANDAFLAQVSADLSRPHLTSRSDLTAIDRTM